MASYYYGHGGERTDRGRSVPARPGRGARRGVTQAPMRKRRKRR